MDSLTPEQRKKYKKLKQQKSVGRGLLVVIGMMIEVYAIFAVYTGRLELLGNVNNPQTATLVGVPARVTGALIALVVAVFLFLSIRQK